MKTMKHWLALSALLTTTAFAQDDWPKPSAASIAYNEYRNTNTTPTFGLSKVQALIKTLKHDQDGGMAVTSAQWNALTVAERFTYTMIHGEDENQNCDASPPIIDENLKIFAYTPPVFTNERGWSLRQRTYLANNRVAIVGLIRQMITSQKRLGANIKGTIQEINGWEFVPDLATLYKRDRKDHDLLTTMMVLMDNNRFPEFLASTTWAKLYGPDSNYQAFISANTANQDLIMQRGARFVTWKKQ